MLRAADLKLAGLACFKRVLRATAARCCRPMAGTGTGGIPKITLKPVVLPTCIALCCTCCTLQLISACHRTLRFCWQGTPCHGWQHLNASTSVPCLGGRRRWGPAQRGHGGNGGARRGGRRVRGHGGRRGGSGSGGRASGCRGGQPSSLMLVKGWAKTVALRPQRCCRLSFLAQNKVSRKTLFT